MILRSACDGSNDERLVGLWGVALRGSPPLEGTLFVAFPQRTRRRRIVKLMQWPEDMEKATGEMQGGTKEMRNTQVRVATDTEEIPGERIPDARNTESSQAVASGKEENSCGGKLQIVRRTDRKSQACHEKREEMKRQRATIFGDGT